MTYQIFGLKTAPWLQCEGCMGRGKSGNREASQEAVVGNHGDSDQSMREEVERTDSPQVKKARLTELETAGMWGGLPRKIPGFW